MSAPAGGQPGPNVSPNATVGSVYARQPIGAIPPKAETKAGPKAGPKVTKKAPKPKRKR